MRASVEKPRLALVVLGLSLIIAAVSAMRSEGPLRGYLPGDNAAPGWAKEGEPQEYEGEDLYTYIDGGAEIYHEYGFRRVIVQDYKNAGGKSVSLEIFEMETAAAAFGMFTFKRSGKGKAVALGGGAELEAYYLNSWKGRFLVTLTGFDEASETIAGLTAIARAVDPKIRDAGDSAAPPLVAALPEKGLKPETVKYLKGLLGLNNIYSFYTARGLNFAEAVRGDYADGTALLVLDYGAPVARAGAWSDLKEYLAGSDRFKRADTPRTDAPVIQDGKGLYLVFAESGPRLLIGIGPDPRAALELVQQAR
jgi:hypothetical protein